MSKSSKSEIWNVTKEYQKAVRDTPDSSKKFSEAKPVARDQAHQS